MQKKTIIFVVIFLRPTVFICISLKMLHTNGLLRSQRCYMGHNTLIVLRTIFCSDSCRDNVHYGGPKA